jgi:RNA-binding protein
VSRSKAENALVAASAYGGRIVTSKQRAYLKSLASNLNPTFQVGKSSLTPEITEAILESFNNNELIKVSVLKNCLDDPREIGQYIADRTHSELVQVIGKRFVLYKPFKENPKIELPK